MPTTADAIPERVLQRLPDLMRAAIAEARHADQPFGCALADFATGELLLAAPNSDASDPTGHAEVNALRRMAERGLDPASILLVSTAEPCPMCASACWWARVRGVVYGTTIAHLLRFGWSQLDLSCTELLARARPPSIPVVLGGFLTAETDPLYAPGPRSRPA